MVGDVAQLILLPSLEKPCVLSPESYKPGVVFDSIIPHSGRRGKGIKSPRSFLATKRVPSHLGLHEILPQKIIFKNTYLMKEDVVAFSVTFCINCNH